MYTSAEQLTIQSHENYNEPTRHHNDTVTWLAEILHGSMRTSFEYHFDGQELYAEDGGAMGEVFDYAITAAKEITNSNPNLLFELRRRIIEQGEYQDMIAMAKGESPNTMVVISDFPEELMISNENVGGYNSDRKQTMLRIIYKQANGNIRMVTQSLDGSNREALEAIYLKLGVEAKPGELLGQRIKLDLPETWQSQLLDNLLGTYDQSLTDQFGSNWHAGIKYSPEGIPVNTAEFVEQQADLIDWFVDEKLRNPIVAEKLRYSLAATMEQRFNGLFDATIKIVKNYSVVNLYAEIAGATKQAINKGVAYSGCGMTVNMNEADGQLREAGYGNKTSPESKYSFDKKMYCVVCQAPPKRGETKKPCGPCGICRTCDKKLGGKG